MTGKPPGDRGGASGGGGGGGKGGGKNDPPSGDLTTVCLQAADILASQIMAFGQINLESNTSSHHSVIP